MRSEINRSTIGTQSRSAAEPQPKRGRDAFHYIPISGSAAACGPHSDQSQRDCDLQPKVARNATLGHKFGNKFNRNAVVTKSRDADENGIATTALRLGMFVGRRPRAARSFRTGTTRNSG